MNRECVTEACALTKILDNVVMQGFYEFINGALILDTLRDFLSHEDPNVRAKACNALGNMCRHSAYFYDSLVSTKQRIALWPW